MRRRNGKIIELRRKTSALITPHDERILAAMAKAVKEVRRHEKITKIKLVVADKKSWTAVK